MPLLDSSKRRRARTRGTTPEAGPDAPVLYWMSRDQRVDDNWALLRACDVAEERGAPVVIVCNVRGTCLGAGARQCGFMLRGLRELERNAAARNVAFALTRGDDPATAIDAFAKKIGSKTIVCDFSPLRDELRWRKEFAALCDARSAHFEECDAHNVVPCWEASDKLEVGARTLRGRLAKRYPEFLREFPEMPTVSAAYRGPAIEEVKWDAVLAEALERGAAVPEVTWALPGETAARAVLDDFVNNRMRLYEKRNDPSKPRALSGLSPWLHFGQISGQRCALEAKKAVGKASPPAYDAFFEELVVRRELSDNFCYYSPQYDRIEGQKYDWAKDTLREHAADKRPYVYTLEELERAKTHDDLPHQSCTPE